MEQGSSGSAAHPDGRSSCRLQQKRSALRFWTMANNSSSNRNNLFQQIGRLLRKASSTGGRLPAARQQRSYLATFCLVGERTSSETSTVSFAGSAGAAVAVVSIAAGMSCVISTPSSPIRRRASTIRSKCAVALGEPRVVGERPALAAGPVPTRWFHSGRSCRARVRAR